MNQLLLLAGVIFIICIALFVFLPEVQTETPSSMEIESQKTGCSFNGIGLPNYDHFPANAKDAANWMVVEYWEMEVSPCTVGPKTSGLLKGVCKIGDPAKAPIELQVRGTGCVFMDKT